MATIRSLLVGWLEGRYGYEGNQTYGAMAALLLIGALSVAVYQQTGPALGIGTLGLGLLTLRVPRLALPLLIAIAAIAWVLFGPEQPAY